MKLMSVVPIDQLQKGHGGGKARGLALLKTFGCQIPETYVITGAEESEVKTFINTLPDDKEFAVRSSAATEDGEEHSYAGQYKTFLNVKGQRQLFDAISACFASVDEENVKVYKQKAGDRINVGMNVLVQEMVKAKYSGVIFSVEPVKQRHDRISLTVTKGTGDDLMSGRVTGDTLVCYKHDPEIKDIQGLSKKVVKTLIDSAKDIEKQYGKPADLEWVVDEKDEVWWLQLRPVTGLDDVHLNELDHEPNFEKPIYTRGNIGEMMPGPVTPLTLSTFARAIEVGLQVFYKKIGSLKELSDDNLFVHAFYNNLFFDIEKLYDSTRNVLLSKKENIDMTIVGSIVPGKEVKLEAGFIKGLSNFIRMMKYVNSAPKARKQLEELNNTFSLACPDDIEQCFRMIDQNMQVLFDAYSLHYITSSQSGALLTTILNIYSKRKTPQRRHLEQVGGLFNDIPDIESANALRLMDGLSHLLAKQEDIYRNFIDVPNKDALTYLTSTGPEAVVKAWKSFIERHGHRCVREAELWEEEWAVNPDPVLESLKTKIPMIMEGAVVNRVEVKNKAISLEGHELSRLNKIIVKKILFRARRAVAWREQTKAWSISIQHRFKKAYRYLAELLVSENLLKDTEEIFFLQHHEIGELIRSGDARYWQQKADKRRRQYPEMQKLSFPDLSFGIPVPEDRINGHLHNELSGIPVSQGIIEGKVRLVNDMSDARLLKKNEIMVAKMTDIGWTPFYSVIGGLVTEIGSPLSHGAVVAREYGLPAVVGMKGAMARLKTGQTIKLDAIKGEVQVMN